ncbi:Polygalacturonase [Pustulibacterium marinum]|uniref:Polygalacturonase n=1 Tax=Pustulibacterium marinum TaxID=1224947 RepID=A0A1I7EUE1_9FLAO|nr:glycoside hydrolase family 28 protein [Pustulibacterium marinum]SFU27545.1 Polygalacturonase [Pustulibacterium marinum]
MKKTTLIKFFIALLAFGLNYSCEQKIATKIDSDPWETAETIIQNTTVPSFQDSIFNLTDFGAVGDGVTKDTKAFQHAIEACHNAGGGKIIVSKGTYLTGPIHLKSNVHLHLEEGVEVLFSKDLDDYLPLVHTSYEGVELMNYSPLIYAKDQKNIAITGKGIFNGQANQENWWPWCGSERYGHKEGMPAQKDAHNLPTLRKMNEEQTPVDQRVFGSGHQLRPLFFEVLNCENVIVSGVTFTNAPFWVLHPLKSSNITIDGVTVNSHGPNNDGCDPEYCKNVVIKNCIFNTGDDCIAIKSGRNNDGRAVNIPSENIVVQNCTMKDGHGGVVMGSEISAGVRNVFVRNCTMDSPNLDRAIRIKTNTLRGGFVENVYVKDIEVGQVKESVLRINTFYGIYANQEGDYMPNIENINLENITVKNGGKYGILIKGRAENPVKNITLKNVTIDEAQQTTSIENAEKIKYINTKINGEIMN